MSIAEREAFLKAGGATTPAVADGRASFNTSTGTTVSDGSMTPPARVCARDRLGKMVIVISAVMIGVQT